MRLLACVFAALAAPRGAAGLRVAACTGAPAQAWALDATASTRVRADNLCLATLSCAPAAGDGVALAACDAPRCAGGADQLWTLDAGLLTSAASRGALTLTLANTVGPNVNLWRAAGAVDNGEWDYSGAPGGAAGALRTRSAAAAHGCLDAGGGAGGTIFVNASLRGLPLYGVGGLAAIGGARLIHDYPAAIKADILDLLFNASGGTAFQVLKTEIEGDMDSRSV